MKKITILSVLLLVFSVSLRSQNRGLGTDGLTSVCSKFCAPQGYYLEVYEKTGGNYIIKLFKTNHREYVTESKRTVLNNTPSIIGFSSQLITQNGNASNNKYCDRYGNIIWGSVYEVTYSNTQGFSNGETSVITLTTNLCKDYTTNQLLSLYEQCKLQNSPKVPTWTSFGCIPVSSGGIEVANEGQVSISLDNDPDQQQDEDLQNSPNTGSTNSSGIISVKPSLKKKTAAKKVTKNRMRLFR